MSSILKQISKKKFNDKEKQILLDCEFPVMKSVLKRAGHIEYKKDLTKSMFKMYKLVANDATEEEKLDFIINRNDIQLRNLVFDKITYFRMLENLINKLGNCYYNFFTYSSSEPFAKLFSSSLDRNTFLIELDNIKNLENIGSITNIDKQSSILDIKDEVLDFFIQDAKEEIIAFKEGYGFEEPIEDDFENIEEYIEALESHNDTLNYVQNLIKSSNIRLETI